MSTKIWQERFEEEFWGKFGSTKTINEIKQFITDLRKQDEEELIKMLPVKNGRTEQLIKDYYKE